MQNLWLIPAFPFAGFLANSIFGRVERRLIEIAERMRRAESGGGEIAAAQNGLDEHAEDT